MAHLGPRRGTLGAIETVRQRVADLQIVLDRTRAYIHHAARLADDPDPVGKRPFVQARIVGQEAALEATELALRVLGATAIAGDVPAARLHLDAHALLVMYPNLDMDRLAVADEALAALAAPPGA
jgi:alkylation response protein AidB-like acyl-CoA dehydrogenase